MINKKLYYSLIFNNEEINKNFNFYKLEGVNGFKQHIISNNVFTIIYKEKYNILEITTFNNKLFIYGKLIK